MCVHAFLAGATLQRFLVARKFDVEEAFKMLMNYVHWRLSYPENAVKQEEIRDSLDARKVYVTKHTDRAGRICIVVGDSRNVVQASPCRSFLSHSLSLSLTLS